MLCLDIFNCVSRCREQARVPVTRQCINEWRRSAMLDWNDLRFFLAVARNGNLSAAARELRVSQPTVGRRLASLEATLGVRLLNRTPDGYVLTLAGRDVRERAEHLEREAQALERTVSGRDTRLSGPVRVTCAETMAAARSRTVLFRAASPTRRYRCRVDP